jgi:hypothetical protein
MDGQRRSLLLMLILIKAWPPGSAAGAEPDTWADLPRETAPSLQIRWARGDGGSDWRAGPAEITRGDAVRLHVEPLAGASVRWFQIAPDTQRFYKNANHPWEANAYKWVGFARVDYRQREITAWRGRWDLTLRPPAPGREYADLAWSGAGRFYHADLGTFWFTVEVGQRDRVLRSPGLSETTERGLSLKVFRLSVRQDDSLVGWLTSYFNVPGIFGSTPYQSENYLGVDCADCVVAGWSKWKKQPLARDWNVAGVVGNWPKALETELSGGAPATEIRWGATIRPGDFIAVRYPGGRQYQHIGALHSDANGNGKLDPEDRVIHAGPDALQVSALSTGNFDGHVVIIRSTAR